MSFILLPLFSFFVAGQLIRHVVPDTLPYTLRNKISVLENSEEPVDLIFIGSSLTHKGISPDLFDREMGRLGVSINSFNMGDNQLMPPESYALANHVLKKDLPHWNILVIELFRLDDTWRDDGDTRRYVWWHDFTETRCALESIWHAPLPSQRKRHLSKLHLKAWLLEQFNLGQLLDVIRMRPEVNTITVGPQADGFVSFPFSADFHETNKTWMTHNLDREINRTFLNHVDDYKERTAYVAEKPWDTWPANPGHLARLKKFDRLMKDRNIDVIYLIHPVTERTQPELALVREAGLEHVIDLNDPKRYPELYEVSSRWDNNHLSSRGIALLTRTLADQMAPIIAASREEEP
ncbi:MAG: hypothetical protein AAF492_03590 [Verrucomicrobiota bacterium]